jgi:hypothetical protein
VTFGINYKNNPFSHLLANEVIEAMARRSMYWE